MVIIVSYVNVLIPISAPRHQTFQATDTLEAASYGSTSDSENDTGLDYL